MNLLSLLGAAPDAVEGVDVTVPRARGNTAGPIPIDMGNSRSLVQAQDALGAAPEHKGQLFGAKGTLRDVLGLLGDAFLTQAGQKTVYAPKRAQERESDALGGFTQDPMAAIERLSQVNPTAAQKFYDDFGQNQARQAQVQSLAQSRIDLAQDRKNDNKRSLQPYIFNMIGAAKDAGAYGIAYRQAKRMAEAQGFDLEKDFGIDPEFNGASAPIIQAGGMTPKDTVAATQRDEAEAGRNTRADKANKAAMDRTQVTVGGANARDDKPQPTPASLFDQYSKIPKEKRTPEQQAYIDKQTNIGGGKKRAIPPLPPGFAIKKK